MKRARVYLERELPAIEAFMAAERARGLTGKALKEPGWTVRGFASSLTDRSLFDADAADLEAWLDSRQLAPNTGKHRRIIVRRFYRWARREGLCDYDLTPKARGRRAITLAEWLASSDPVFRAHLTELLRRNLRPSTIYQRGRVLARFQAWLAANNGHTITTVGRDELEAFLDHLANAESRATELSHLRGWFKWLVLEGIRDDDPTVRIPNPKCHAGSRGQCRTLTSRGY